MLIYAMGFDHTLSTSSPIYPIELPMLLVNQWWYKEHKGYTHREWAIQLTWNDVVAYLDQSKSLEHMILVTEQRLSSTVNP